MLLGEDVILCWLNSLHILRLFVRLVGLFRIFADKEAKISKSSISYFSSALLSV